MVSDYEKTEKVLEALKRSSPVLANSDELTENVLKRLKQERTAISPAELVYEILFGWVYIGWMRRIMVTAAAVIVIFFGYEQAVILKRINDLSGKSFIEAGTVRTSVPYEIPDAISRYRFFGRKTAAINMKVSEKEIEKLIKSVNDLQVRYRDVFELIESDPELKKYFDDRINKIEISKPNI